MRIFNSTIWILCLQGPKKYGPRVHCSSNHLTSQAKSKRIMDPAARESKKKKLVDFAHFVRILPGFHYFDCAESATSAQLHSSKNSASDVQPKL